MRRGRFISLDKERDDEKDAAVNYSHFSCFPRFGGFFVWAGEFAADFKQYQSWEDEGQKQKSGKVFVKADKSRMEFIQDGQVAGIMIVNPQKKAAWMMDTSEKTYMEINFPENLWQLAKSGDTGNTDIKQTKLGQETISGYLCEKISYSYKEKSVGNTVVWLSNKLEYPVKWENKGQQGTSWFRFPTSRRAS